MSKTEYGVKLYPKGSGEVFIDFESKYDRGRFLSLVNDGLTNADVRLVNKKGGK